MRTEKDVEAYLLRSTRRYRALGSDTAAVQAAGAQQTQPLAASAPNGAVTFLVEVGNGLPPIAVRVDPPLVVVRAHVGNVTKTTNQASLFRRLLEMNARQLVHASYGIEDDRVVLSSALELENLDFNEIQAALDEIDVALSQHLPEL